MKSVKNILIAFILNISFSLIELIGGFITGSIAILSDSLHDAGDALSIGVAYFLEKKSKKKPDSKYTYGYIRYSVLGSIITTFILLFGSIIVIVEAIKRLFNPITINYNGMIILAIFGVIINFFAAYYTKDDDSLNERSVNLHMLEDVLGWVVVLIGSILMKLTNISYFDSILSIGVAIFIFYHAFLNLKKVIDLFLEKTPKDIDIKKLQKELLSIPKVEDVHHIHIRSLDGYNNYATMHVVIKKYDEKLKAVIKAKLQSYNIVHSTIEFETETEKCLDINCKVNKE